MDLRATPDGVEIPVKAVPKSSHNRVAGIVGDRLKVCVTAAPEKGKANDAVVGTIADWLGVAKSAVSVVAGETSPKKTVRVRGLGVAQVKSRLL